MKRKNFDCSLKKDLYLHVCKWAGMSISTWIHARLETHKDSIILLGVLSSILTIVGLIMSSIWNLSFNNSSFLIVSLLLVINTLITITLIYLNTRKKTELNGWKKDYEMLLDECNESMREVLNLREKLQRIYEKEPALNPSKEQTLTASIVLAPPTQRDEILGKRLHELGRI
jgi:hypothetical protein